MRFVDEYRDGKFASFYAESIRSLVTKPWSIMEICGGQTHSIVKYGIETLLPDEITLVHGPGCPVCVTPLEMIDRAIAIAERSEVLFTSFGDMLRVPGTQSDLLTVKANGGSVRIVYSPLDALRLAREHPEKEVVFFAVGFETTAPANAMAVIEAHRTGIRNFSVLCSQVLVPPAVEAILGTPSHNIRGLLAAGHVCTVMGFNEYLPIASRYQIPIVVTGFEPVDILQGIFMTVKQLEEGRAVVENQYSRVVRPDGNIPARELLNEVFEVTDRTWRGIGEIPQSGLRLRKKFADFDAERRFQVDAIRSVESPDCIAGAVLCGLKRPYECPAFGSKCTPEHPLGAPMVSSEGSCAAYFQYGRSGHEKVA
ncbi:MAG TPA: hydrogenase formation protein HypD [Bacteroidota bacterium]|nr:hydrogenase formation protein HypD [Bacteroidota bacterium]